MTPNEIRELGQRVPHYRFGSPALAALHDDCRMLGQFGGVYHKDRWYVVHFDGPDGRHQFSTLNHIMYGQLVPRIFDIL